MRIVVPTDPESATASEHRVVHAWRALPYQAFGVCATCGNSHSHTGRRLLLCGVNGDSRVCLSCFEFEHDCRAPNYRRRRQPKRLSPALAHA